MSTAVVPAGEAMNSPPAPPTTPQTGQKADLAAWLGVIAGAIGSLMATLDVSIVNASLPTIQGEIGASSTEGTWISTSFLVAEIIIIPLSGWLERVFGLRRFLLIVAILFTSFSILCGISDTLTVMIIGRVGQGITGGAMIPTAMTIIATRLPPWQQPIGVALFGSTIILGPVLGPLVGGWLTENLSWHYAFLINVPICAVLITLLLVGLPNEKMQPEEIANADWLGIAGLILGLGGLTVVIEEGHREQWFESALIWQLSGVAIFGFILVGLGQVFAARPVIKLALLRNRAFGAVFILGLVVGAALFGVSYTIPQFLAALAGYNALQAGSIVFLAGVPAMLMMPLFPFLVRFDLRAVVVVGFILLAFSCWLDMSLTAFSTGGDFIESQLVRGLGQVLAMLFLNQAAISSVPPQDAGDAAGLFSAARNLGGSIGIALLAALQDQRLDYHRWTLHSSLPENSPAVQEWVAGQASLFGGGPEGLEAAYRAIDGSLVRDALAMAYNDSFTVLAIGCLAVAPLALLLRPLPKGRGTMAMH